MFYLKQFKGLVFIYFLVIIQGTPDISQRIHSMTHVDLPSILVPLVGLVFPAVIMASMFLYIEKEQIS